MDRMDGYSKTTHENVIQYTEKTGVDANNLTQDKMSHNKLMKLKGLETMQNFTKEKKVSSPHLPYKSKQALIDDYNNVKSDIGKSNQNGEKLREENLRLHKEYMYYYKKWRDYDLLTAILGNSGFIVFFIYNEMEM